MYIPNDDKFAPTVNYNWLKRLDTQNNDPTNQNSMKFYKAVKPTRIREHYYKTLGTIVITAQCFLPP